VATAVFERCRIDGFAFDVEVLALVRRLGYGIAEVPVAWRDSRDSRVRPVRDGLRMVCEVVAIRARARSVRRAAVATREVGPQEVEAAGG